MDRYVTLREAAKHLGWSRGALRDWVRRYNLRNPTNAVRRLCGRLCLIDLETAIQTENQRYAPPTTTADGNHLEKTQ